MKEAYAQGLESEAEENAIGDQIKPKDVGHNIYILAHQVTPWRVCVCFLTCIIECVGEILCTMYIRALKRAQ